MNTLKHLREKKQKVNIFWNTKKDKLIGTTIHLLEIQIVANIWCTHQYYQKINQGDSILYTGWTSCWWTQWYYVVMLPLSKKLVPLYRDNYHLFCEISNLYKIRAVFAKRTIVFLFHYTTWLWWNFWSKIEEVKISFI